MILQKKKKADFIDLVTRRSTVLPIAEKKQGLDFLVSFFSAIRPSYAKGKGDPRANMQFLIGELHKHPVFLTNLQHAILSQLANTDLSTALTESGIPLARGFWEEFFGRLRHKLLPPLQGDNNFLYVLNHIFSRKTHYQWVEKIPSETWILFFDQVSLSLHVDDSSILLQVLQSLKILAFQVAQLGLEKEVFDYIPASAQESNPFVSQNYLIHDLEELFTTAETDADEVKRISRQINSMVAECHECLDYIRRHHSRRGASLRQTYTLVILQNKLERMNILVDILDQNKAFDTEKFVDFFKMLVRNENRKNSIREFLSQCLGYIAYQIAEHKGTKGNKYITATWGEYRTMLVSAMQGGVIICFVAIIKNLLTAMQMPIFWHGFSYSVNYSLGFVAIEETHSTLATKQPAFTASAVASSLDTRKHSHQPNLYNLAVAVAKVSRSQIASFIGNLIVVFPGTFLLAWLYYVIRGTKISSGDAAMALLESQHPWHSLSLLYACNAGFFLFMSGIIAGYVQNKIQYAHIATRLIHHPLLEFSLPEKKLHRLANYIEKHAGAIVGNISLGFMLGMAVLIPNIFGIPFDIRHITISAGNVAIAVYGLGIDQINPLYLLTIVVGVLGIGFINFLVSFTFAFIVAVKSRGVHLKDYPEFIGILARYFFRKPLNFIRPPAQSSPETE